MQAKNATAVYKARICIYNYNYLTRDNTLDKRSNLLNMP